MNKKKIFSYGQKVVVKAPGKCHGMTGIIVGRWDDYIYKNCYKVKLDERRLTICVNEKNLVLLHKELEVENNMAKLTGYKNVAVIRQGYYEDRDYYFAIYEDGFDYHEGDKVIVSGDKEIKIISEILTAEQASERYGKNITAEIICPVNTKSYDERVEKRKEADALKKKMDKIIKDMEEINKYQIYADMNPELKEMLDKYKTIVGD